MSRVFTVRDLKMEIAEAKRQEEEAQRIYNVQVKEFLSADNKGDWRVHVPTTHVLDGIRARINRLRERLHVANRSQLRLKKPPLWQRVKEQE